MIKPFVPITSPINGRPPGLRVERRDGRLTLRFAWRSFSYMALGAVAVLLIAVGVSVILSREFLGLRWLASAPLLAGPPMLWLALAGFFNRTIIEVTSEALTVRHGPVWWPSPRRLTASEILQLYVELRSLGPRRGPLCRVMAAMQDGRRVAITWYLPGDRSGWGRYIEKEIEQQLRIVDRPIVCPGCGYDLRATLRRCPECGYVLRSNRKRRRAWAKEIARQARRDVRNNR